MNACAQTNAQLFMQLHDAGCSPAELRRARDAFLLAMQLYSGLFTGSGKTTLAHETGTASLVHRHGGSFDLTVAGLLHGAYLVGDWGYYRVRITEKKRATLRSVVGAASEAYVYEYARRPWDGVSIAEIAARAYRLDETERNVSLLRLAEELERLLDYGALVAFRDVSAMKTWLRGRRDDLCRIADGLGRPALSAELATGIDRTLGAELPAEVTGLKFPGAAAYRVVPRSYRKRLALGAYQTLAGCARRVERGLREWLTPGAATDDALRRLRRP